MMDDHIPSSSIVYRLSSKEDLVMIQAQRAPTGILKPAGQGAAFKLERFAPSADLGYFVLRYWRVAWDVPEQAPYTQETLPYPCVNLVVERGRSGIFGVNTRRFQVQLEAKGWVFGIKFRPGAFYPFYQAPAATLTDRAIGLDTVFGAAGAAYERQVLSCVSVDDMIGCAEQFLRARLPAPDEHVALINTVVEQIAGDRAITRVAQVADGIGISRRTLQRLFSQYVGVSPKWVIQRYRLLEAADQLAQNANVDLPGLAQTLGYFDQAHFINDFRATIGSTPAEYAQRHD
jgi:AraC-like DNA-binding protein